MDLIVLRNVRKQYKTGVVAIHDLSLNIAKGDFVFVIGSTGCGKSTLIKMLYREEKPTSGKIIVGGIDVAKLRNSKVYRTDEDGSIEIKLNKSRYEIKTYNP